MARRSAAASAVDPAMLAKLKGEDSFIQSEQRTIRRVKVERGKIWVVRFLPVELGPEKTWFARIARHWLNSKPVICPRTTHKDFGGDPKHHCPVCHISDELNASPNEAVSKFGYSVRATPQWITFCVVYEKDGQEQQLQEVLQPYEFAHYKSTWEELKGFFLSNATANNSMSVLDYENGNDFSVTRTGKGTRLDKLEAQPIFEEDKMDAYIQKIESAIKDPSVKIPSEGDLRAFMLKVEEGASDLEAGEKGGRRRGRQAGMEETDADDDAKPGRRSREAAGGEEAETPRSRRGKPAAAPPEEEDDVPYDDKPKASPKRTRAAAPPVEEEDPVNDEAEDADDTGAEPDDADDPEDADPEEVEPVEKPQGRTRGKLPPPPAAIARSGNRSSRAEDEIEEEDNVAEEESDLAPPKKARIREGEDDGADAPVRPNRTGAAIKGKLDSIRKRRG